MKRRKYSLTILCIAVAAAAVLKIIGIGNVLTAILLTAGLLASMLVFREETRRSRIAATDNIVEEIRKIGELTTARYCEELLIKTSRDASGQVVFTEDRMPHLMKSYLIKRVRGTVRAGFDLSNVEASDITFNERVLTLKLPHAKILETIVHQDDIETLVESGKWSHENSVDVMQKAYEMLERNAAASGLIPSAETSAKTELKHIGRLLGFNEVKISYK